MILSIKSATFWDHALKGGLACHGPAIFAFRTWNISGPRESMAFFVTSSPINSRSL
jgi:hypothetical protein